MVQKLWLILDIQVNGARILLMHNSAYFTAQNLFNLQLFFVKLDMLYQDPIHSHGGEWRMRECLLAERTLTTLWNYLRRADGRTRLDILRLWVKHGYKRPAPEFPMREDEQAAHDAKIKLPIMGVPAALVGRWGMECWGLGNVPLLRPDELLMREGARRGVELHRYYLRMMAAGYVDSHLRPIPVPKPEEAVLSLVRRKKNRELAAEERRRATGVDDAAVDVEEQPKDAVKVEPRRDIDVLRERLIAMLSGQT